MLKNVIRIRARFIMTHDPSNIHSLDTYSHMLYNDDPINVHTLNKYSHILYFMMTHDSSNLHTIYTCSIVFHMMTNGLGRVTQFI